MPPDSSAARLRVVENGVASRARRAGPAVARKNPFLEAERARKRESLPAAAEADLAKIAAACARARRPLRGQDKIAVRVEGS
jgi:hypothetical protein